MTTESDIVTALTSLVSGRIFPDAADFSTPKPYITYSQVGGEAVAFLERAMPSKKNGRYQVNVWAADRAGAAALALQIESALVLSTAFQASAEGAPTALFEADLKLYGSMQDFSIWSDR